MGQTLDKLNYLMESKTLIKQAIKEVGGEVSDTDTLRSYVNKIKALNTGGGSAPEDLTAELAAQDEALTNLEDAVNNLPDAGSSTPAKLIEGQATQNGEYWAKDFGADGFEVFTVNVQDKVQATPSILLNVTGTWTINPDGSANTTNNVYYNFTPDAKIQVIALGNIAELGTYWIEDNKIHLSAEGEEMTWYYNDDGGIAVEEGGESMMWRLVPQTTKEVEENGEYDVVANTKVIVNVESSGGSGDRDPNETMYEMQKIDKMLYLNKAIAASDIPSEAEYLEQQEYVNSAIAIIMGEEFNG